MPTEEDKKKGFRLGRKYNSHFYDGTDMNLGASFRQTRLIPGFWSTMFAPESDWSGLKTGLTPKKSAKGWEEHEDHIPYQPGHFKLPSPEWYSGTIHGPWKGRNSNTTELDWENPILNRGRQPDGWARVREEDPMWYDPPAKPQDVYMGLNSRDLNYTPTITMKGDRPMPLSEWQKIVAEGTFQGKIIREKFNISPQHPGMFQVIGNMDSMKGQPPETIGVGEEDFFNTNANIWPSLARTYPRFFDSPLHVAPYEKAGFGAKYGLFYGVFRSGVHILMNKDKIPGKGIPYNWDGFALVFGRSWRWALPKFLPAYVGYPTAFCGLLSASSMARDGKDDIVNGILPAAVLSTVYASVDGRTIRGFWLFGGLMMGTYIWLLGRNDMYGWSGKTFVREHTSAPHPTLFGTMESRDYGRAERGFNASIDLPKVPGAYPI